MAEKKQKRSAPRRTRQRFVRNRRTNLFLAVYDAWVRRKASEFRPDNEGTDLLKLLHLTQTQRNRYLRWGLYCLSVVAAIVLQDVIMSQIRPLGAPLDLPAAMILTITILEGSETGSIFAMAASIFYFFSGSAPGAYCVGLLVTLGTLLSLFRQKIWHRSSGSIILCSAIALFLYELGLFGSGLFLGLTTWRYFMRFILTAAYSSVLLIPFYHLELRIGLIGGNVWKE